MVLIDLLPLIVGAAVLPMWIVAVLLLLRSEGGGIKAAAFAAGAMTVRVLQGILFGFVFDAAASASGKGGSKIITSTLLLVVGILLLVTTVRTWRKEDDPDALPPRWTATLSGLSSFKTLGIGALLMAISIKQWVFTLSAVAVVDEAKLGLTGSILAYLLFVLAAQSLVLAPIIGSAVAPTRSAKVLAVLQGRLERHSRTITTVVSSIFGMWFLGKGITGLLG
jgi:hypothetical protein